MSTAGGTNNPPPPPAGGGEPRPPPPRRTRPAALAIGYEHRNEYGGYINQPILAAGWDSDTGSPGPLNTLGHFYVNEGYAELIVPLVNHIPGAEDLEVQGAVRAFDYNTFGS